MFHHFICHAAKEQGIRPLDVLERVTMEVFVNDPDAMIAASVQRNVDGISKGSHYVRVIFPNDARVLLEGLLTSTYPRHTLHYKVLGIRRQS